MAHLVKTNSTKESDKKARNKIYKYLYRISIFLVLVLSKFPKGTFNEAFRSTFIISKDYKNT